MGFRVQTFLGKRHTIILQENNIQAIANIRVIVHNCSKDMAAMTLPLPTFPLPPPLSSHPPLFSNVPVPLPYYQQWK